VKPANILLGDDQYTYLSDFGLTKLASSQSPQCRRTRSA
jgi:serine/threonine protein kinase